MPKKRKSVFVTVGTTQFDSLIEALDTPECADALRGNGYGSVVIQRGKGTRELPTPLEVRVFDFAPSLADEMLAADLVVSHAGSGSVFEALGMRKPLLVVVNDALMDNHQAELAEELGKRGHLRWCESGGLANAIATFDPRGLTPYEPGDPSGIARALDDALA
ncbi:glycosyltransferase family 1 protein [Micromonas commoda]|uniref:Glycosyltransferase family 1 protein n=1 Tax=Micromonas commoda (strain RCC299 / NOUM17 / CCMP2709) TaxID=296587 RepID=C1E0Y0_MICCC|nr:glycosyltransferase family 1 protein [Micromonas commoda]ACO62081.1 glycosyltransferase family 1 protein [Micromonas commoda]|eukprot:XP_002500823.1 glycosyltransferase family 1 protein [Micromonas commoda]